jgi:hypothetical protein
MWHQRGSLCLWDAHKRGHLPGWVNIASTLLWTDDADEASRLRLRHAPEPSWLHMVGVLLAMVGALIAWALVFCLVLETEFAVRALNTHALGSLLSAKIWQPLGITPSHAFNVLYGYVCGKAREMPGSKFRLLPLHLIFYLVENAMRVMFNLVAPPQFV